MNTAAHLQEKRMGDVEVVVEVTAQDIAKGERQSCFACPIALALSRHMFPTPAVNRNYIESTDRPWVRELPSEARDFITDFDTGQLVSPFTFKLSLPPDEVR